MKCVYCHKRVAIYEISNVPLPLFPSFSFEVVAAFLCVQLSAGPSPEHEIQFLSVFNAMCPHVAFSAHFADHIYHARLLNNHQTSTMLQFCQKIFACTTNIRKREFLWMIKDTFKAVNMILCSITGLIYINSGEIRLRICCFSNKIPNTSRNIIINST